MVIIKNGVVSGIVWLFIVMFFFFIVLSKVDCVFGEVWLILLVSMIFFIIGLGWYLNFIVFVL